MSNIVRRRILASSMLGLSFAAAGIFGVANSFAQASASASASASTSDTPATQPTEASKPAPAAPDAVVNGPKVLFKTSMGDIVVQLNAEKAPKTVANFMHYVNNKHYQGTVFHRVIDGFMIQGGGFDAAMKQKPTASAIQNEAKNGLKNETYTIAMARTGFPHSATSQFFINVNNNSPLDYPSRDGWGYCVFGKVVQGTEVVDAIAKVGTTTVGQFENVPKKPIVINSVSVVK